MKTIELKFTRWSSQRFCADFILYENYSIYVQLILWVRGEHRSEIVLDYWTFREYKSNTKRLIYYTVDPVNRTPYFLSI
jgi:hypothetical protein